MKTTKHLNIYYLDSDNDELEYFRNNFILPNNIDFSLFTYNSFQMCINKLETDIKDASFKIIIINNIISSRGLNNKTALELIPVIKNIDIDNEVIIFADSENIELKATVSNVKPAAFVKKTTSYFIRLYPIISRLISEYELKKAKRKLKIIIVTVLITLIILLVFFIISVILVSYK